VVAISRGPQKEELALRLGAHRYIDGAVTNAADELTRLGGARVIVATAPNSDVISGLVSWAETACCLRSQERRTP
jgi:D-arabinose 1-dehydrogenase-like Zn-dependent alcohol dehydrogenase